MSIFNKADHKCHEKMLWVYFGWHFCWYNLSSSMARGPLRSTSTKKQSSELHGSPTFYIDEETELRVTWVPYIQHRWRNRALSYMGPLSSTSMKQQSSKLHGSPMFNINEETELWVASFNHVPISAYFVMHQIYIYIYIYIWNANISDVQLYLHQ